MTNRRNAQTDDEMLDDSDEALARALMSSDSDAAKSLREYFERREALEEERKGINDDLKDLKTEMKSRGFDGKALDRIAAIRKIKREDYQQFEGTVEAYMNALGML